MDQKVLVHFCSPPQELSSRFASTSRQELHDKPVQRMVTTGFAMGRLTRIAQINKWGKTSEHKDNTMIDLDRKGEIFTLTMNDGENRWNTTFVREFAAALDTVEASDGPAALVTTSTSEKFFSNGLDLEWRKSEGEHRGGDRTVFGAEFMALMGRLITFPVPTVCAINGHAFGAGFMAALCHDVRFMRRDRGFICANEIQLGMIIPPPELALFQHKIPMNAFFETVQLARRWTGPDALAAGIVQQAEPQDTLLDAAVQRATELAPLGANRKVYQAQKESIYGENAAINNPHGPAYMLRNSAQYRH